MHPHRPVDIAPAPLRGVRAARVDGRRPRRGQRGRDRGEHPLPALPLALPVRDRRALIATGRTGIPSSSQVSLPSHRRTMDIVGASVPDATQSQVASPSTGRYSSAASARTKQA